MKSKCVFLGLIVLFVLMSGHPKTITAQNDNSPTASDMEAALNAWRLEAELSPMKANPTLEALAQLQLNYILQLPNIPPNIHDGILHEDPRERALWEPYEWPYYGITARVSLEEITVAQKTVAQGILWWKRSPVHNEAATNPNYREMGVAAAPYPNGTVFVAVLAGRPDVFPAMIHPDGNTLYLTRETYSGVMSQHLSQITRVRLLDADQKPLTDWQAWQETLVLDDISDPIFYVEYSDGKRSVLTEVDRERDVFPLTGYNDLEVADLSGVEDFHTPDKVNIEIATVTDEMFILKVANPTPLFLTDFEFFALQLEPGSPSASFAEQVGTTYAGTTACFIFLVTDAPLTVPESCSEQIVVTYIVPDERFWYDSTREMMSRLFVLSDRGSLLADCSEQVVGCTFEVAALPLDSGGGLQVPATKHIRLEYTSNSLTLINEGGQTLNISQLKMSDGEKIFSALAWNEDENGYIWRLPAGDCFQVALSGTRSPYKPTDCNLRHGWTSVRASQQFWTSDTFEVRLNNNVLKECDANAGECVFELP